MKVIVRLSIVIVGLGIVVSARMCQAPITVAGTQEQHDWKTLIRSHTEKERSLAHDLVLGDRKETVQHLLSVVNRPVEPGEPFYASSTSRNVAITLLGELRAAEGVWDLASWLSPKAGQALTRVEMMMFSPAGEALVKIGLPSLQALAQVLKSDPRRELREQCLKMIVQIKGLRGTELLVEDLVSVETDQKQKENLEAAQNVLQEPKFRNTLEKLDKRRTWL